MTASLLSSTLDRRSVTSKLILCALITTAAILSFNLAHRANWSSRMPGTELHASEEQLDKNLSVAASTALGQREGTIIVMDPQSGRVRAVVGLEYAFGAAYAPGSTIKPFTTLAALRDGLITKDSRILCREHYVHEDFETVCSHPTALPPLRPTEAIAYSCNYYFGKLGEQLPQSSFNSTLAEFGFGRQTGINWSSDEEEAAGRVAGTKWRSENALGESDQILVTPIQLLTAYSALLNGGHLMSPRIAPEKDFVPQERLQLQIEDQQRQLIIDGMRGSIRYGTAERARLHSLPLYVLGKTGTSTQTRGFRTQGWFVGFGSAPDSAEQNHSEPENVTLAVLVFLKRGHGSDAAELARPILEAYAHEMGRRGDTVTPRHGDTETRRRGDTEISASPRLRVAVSRISASAVRVHTVNQNMTRTMTLEDYVMGVVAAEGSTESEPEALKALAVAARTYALKNLDRHRNEGYDFCTTTHCQRYRHINSVNAGAQVSSEVVAAVKQTTGEVLHSGDGQVVDSYFSASCGGATANISTLWNVKAPPHLMGGPDEYCLTMPHHSWTDVISAVDLHRAVRSDPRTDVGNRLSNVIVTRFDRSGRAESILIDGERRQVASGWDFKIVVGRALGWNLLKSSRFEIKRSGSVYVFRGSGFGHGLGLCQEGTHVMARRGASYKQILFKYFPGITVSTNTRDKRQKGERAEGERVEGVMGRRGQNGMDQRGDGPNLDGFLSRRPISSSSLPSFHASLLPPFSLSTLSPLSPFSVSPRRFPARRSLSSEHFQISYPATVQQQEAEQVLRVLETNRTDLIRRVENFGIFFQFPTLELFINETTGDFVGRTGQPPWAAAATRGSRIELQPLDLLKRRHVLETTIRHELVHVVIDAIGGGTAPRWLAEGMALHVAGEGPTLMSQLGKTDTSISDLEQALSRPASREVMHAAYAAAYREVKRLIAAEGESAVWRRVKGVLGARESRPQ